MKLSAKARVALAASVAALGIAAVGCGDSDDDGDSGGSGQPLAGKSVYAISCPDALTFCAAYNDYMKTELGKLGADVTVLTDMFDPAEQVRHMDQAIAAKPDVITVQVTDVNAIVPSLRSAQQAGVPVINSVGRQLDDTYDLLAASVECDCPALGRQAAENIVEGLKAEGRETANVVAITGAQAEYRVTDRITTFEEEMAKYPEYKVVAIEDGLWDPVTTGKIYRELSAKFKSQGGIQAAWGMNDDQTNAIIQAAQQLGEPVGVDEDGLIAVGTSCAPITFKNIPAGLQYAGSTNSPLTEVIPLVEVTTSFLEGEEVEPITMADEQKINAENLNEFEAECNF